MKTLKKVEIEPVYLEFIPKKKDMEQNKVYVSLQYMTSSHLCLCGCGNLSVTPINQNGWFLTDVDNKLTLTPSILNKNCPYKSHYVITKNVANFL
jgi:hypothetical protein